MIIVKIDKPIHTAAVRTGLIAQLICPSRVLRQVEYIESKALTAAL